MWLDFDIFGNCKIRKRKTKLDYFICKSGIVYLLIIIIKPLLNNQNVDVKI